MLTESLISIPCQICYWTSVGPLHEGTEELYNRMSVVWCILALVHASVLFCIHIACGMWQFFFGVGGRMLWRAELGPEEKKQLKNSYTPRAHCKGGGRYAGR